ncbi:hypothetical protein BH23BAC3_BH23BAC3_32040 [soil metagenome]
MPRGLAALGYTLQTPLEDRFLMTTEELNDKICALLGGRVAEEIIFGRISTGARNDLERITTMAFAMVAEYGMSEELGYLSLKDSQNPNNSFGFNKKYSEKTAQRIDQANQEIIKENYKRTLDLLNQHRDKLEKMVETLLEKEVINHHDIRELLGDRPKGNYTEGIFDNNGKTEDTIKKPSVSNGNSDEDEVEPDHADKSDEIKKDEKESSKDDSEKKSSEDTGKQEEIEFDSDIEKSSTSRTLEFYE